MLCYTTTTSSSPSSSTISSTCQTRPHHNAAQWQKQKSDKLPLP